MQHIWRFRLWRCGRFHTVDGLPVSVINPGTLNTAGGPDFFNASVEIDGSRWVGNVELHVRASDWFRHGHHADPAYDNVVLHVVRNSDAEVRRRTDGSVIPQMILECAENLSKEQLENDICSSADKLPCAGFVDKLPKVFVSDCFTRMAYERMQQKAQHVLERLEQNGNNWEETIYQILARALGHGRNADAMEQLSRVIPLKILLSKRDDLFQLYSILAGRAGLLSDDDNDVNARREYEFFCRKFAELGCGEPIVWQWRVRPAVAPKRLVMLLADVLHYDADVLRRIKNAYADGPENVFAGVGPASSVLFGENTVSHLVINVLVPVMFALTMHNPLYDCTDRAMDILASCAPENNAVVRRFRKAGIRCVDALDTQACLHLHANYCQKSHCLGCGIGHRMLAARAMPNDVPRYAGVPVAVAETATP